MNKKTRRQKVQSDKSKACEYKDGLVTARGGRGWWWEESDAINKGIPRVGALAVRRGPGLGLGGRVLPVYCSTVSGGCCYLVTIVLERIAPGNSLLRKTSSIHVLDSYSMDQGERPPATMRNETRPAS